MKEFQSKVSTRDWLTLATLALPVKVVLLKCLARPVSSASPDILVRVLWSAMRIGNEV